MFNPSLLAAKHLLNGTTVTLAELHAISDLVTTTVSVQPDRNRFALAFDSADDLHRASMILCGIRTYTHIRYQQEAEGARK